MTPELRIDMQRARDEADSSMKMLTYVFVLCLVVCVACIGIGAWWIA